MKTDVFIANAVGCVQLTNAADAALYSAQSQLECADAAFISLTD